MPETPAQVLETLALFEVAGDLGADLGSVKGTIEGGDARRYLPCFCERLRVA